MTRLCDKCEKLDLFEPQFYIEDTWADLEGKLNACDFCRMRWDVSQNRYQGQKRPTSIRFDRDQSMLKLNEGYLPVMSICRSSELQAPNANYIQIGLPKLPEPASKTYFGILRQWLRNCDANHPSCQPRKGPLPTRLIDLGTENDPVIRIHQTKPAESLWYTALSHPWGEGGPHFCTFRDTVEEYKKKIPFEKLPVTFQDAVRTTRELGLRYLWIDSICIIQGRDGDFDQEAKRMEDVFSSAYCVIAASSAIGQDDGFLNPRKENDFLTFEKSGRPLYVCRFMDDFNSDVLQGPLNKRGWVLQERALAHRTIFFTNRQTYWECGEGVRCETLTKMQNQLISFLGDPNFPSKISSDTTDRGQRIRLYEDLYRQYSRLAFTRWTDRPIAIAGLENRLIKDLNAHGGFGVFDDGSSFLQRSLLWRRGKEVSSLERIQFPPESDLLVPSWSWMGYKGGIDFLDLPLGGVHWEQSVEMTWPTRDSEGATKLHATARSLRIGEVNGDFETFYDKTNFLEIEEKALKFVVLGKRKVALTKPKTDTTHYVLLIAPKKGQALWGENIYERVGVGYMTGKSIDWVEVESATWVIVQ